MFFFDYYYYYYYSASKKNDRENKPKKPYDLLKLRRIHRVESLLSSKKLLRKYGIILLQMSHRILRSKNLSTALTKSDVH